MPAGLLTRRLLGCLPPRLFELVALLEFVASCFLLFFFGGITVPATPGESRAVRGLACVGWMGLGGLLRWFWPGGACRGVRGWFRRDARKWPVCGGEVFGWRVSPKPPGASGGGSRWG